MAHFNTASGGTTLSLSLLNQGVPLQYAATPALWYVTSDDLSLAQLDTRYLYPVWNVKAYGAVGNGTTVDTTAVQTASRGPRRGRRDRLLPARHVRHLECHVRVQPDRGRRRAARRLRYRATASGGTVLLFGPAQKVTNGSNVVVCRVSPASTTNYTSFFVMRDLTIDGNKTQWASTVTHPRRKCSGSTAGKAPGLTDPVTYATMQNVTIQNCRTYGIPCF